jgi:hypothetical protein
VTSAPFLTTVHLYRVDRLHALHALSRMGLDRGPLSRTPGLRFWKLLGTGDGRTFTIRDADVTRWGLLAVWDTAADLQRFESSSPVARSWNRLATERWRGDLIPTRSRGKWAGQDPFGSGGADDHGGPAAAITRARIRWRRAAQFWRSVPAVSAELHRQPGLRYAVGFGEAPVGLQGTFSVWESSRALTAFAYGGAAHRAAIADTDRLDWYAEELFARFVVVGSSGTVDGRDPIAA